MAFKDIFHKIQKKANVVATVTQASDLDLLETGMVPDGIDVLEFRLDNLYETLDRAEKVASKQQLPLLMTARTPEEGGVGGLGTQERVKLLRRFLPHAALVDIEVRNLSAEGVPSILKQGQEAGVVIIGSFHDFDGFPGLETLKAQIERARNLGADIPKLAVQTDRMADLLQLASLLEADEGPLSLMGMGEQGQISRLLLGKAGSVLNYGFLQTSNAPGQWPAQELAALYERMGVHP